MYIFDTMTRGENMINTHEKFNELTGQNIMKLRTQRHYTREYLAERAKISPKFLYEIEMGKKGCSSYVLYSLAYALEVNLECLIRDGKYTKEKEDAFIYYETFSNKQKEQIKKILQDICEILQEV